MTTETKFWKKKYFTMLAGQSISLITSGILQMSIIFYLTAKTNSAMVLSIATLMGFLPQAVIGPFAGTFVDRHSRKGVMIGADLMIAATGGFLAVVSIFMELPIWLIMLVLFVRSIGNAFHSPASSAVTPLMVPQDQLTKCAGYNQTMQADIIGAVLACGVVAVLSIPNPPICPGESQNSFFRDMKEGYFELKKNKGLFALLWIGTAYMFFFMPISALYPLMSMGYFRGTPTHASIAEIAFAGGMLAGGILLSVWGGFKNRIFSIGLSVLVMGVSIAISGLLPTNAFFIFVICCTVMGLTSPFYGVQDALFQEQLPPEYLGRVFSLLGSVMSFAMPLGLLCSGIFAERIGVEKWFLLCGIGIIAVAVLVFVLPVLRNVDCQSQNSFARKSDD